jgi:hypothetical protein
MSACACFFSFHSCRAWCTECVLIGLLSCSLMYLRLSDSRSSVSSYIMSKRTISISVGSSRRRSPDVTLPVMACRVAGCRNPEIALRNTVVSETSCIVVTVSTELAGVQRMYSCCTTLSGVTVPFSILELYARFSSIAVSFCLGICVDT